MLGLDVVLRVRDRNFWVFVIGVLAILVPLSFYFSYCNTFLVEAGAHVDLWGRRFEPAALQTLGQASEFVFLLLLPAFLSRFGVKGVLVTGMFAWTVRYALFAYAFGGGAATMPMVIAGMLLHGVCYDFFFVASQIYVDQRFEAAARTRAQSFLVMINMGVGIVLGSNLANAVYTANTAAASVHDWKTIWLVPALVALVSGADESARWDGYSLRPPRGAKIVGRVEVVGTFLWPLLRAQRKQFFASVG